MPAASFAAKLPEELNAELSLAARNPGAGDHAEKGIAEIAIGIRELSMVEDVEEFSAELEGDGLFDDGPLGKAEVRVVQPRSVEQLAGGCPQTIPRAGSAS